MSYEVYVRVPAESAEELVASGAFEYAASEDRAIPDLILAAAVVLKDSATVILAVKAGLDAARYLVSAARRLAARGTKPVKIIVSNAAQGTDTLDLGDSTDDETIIRRVAGGLGIVDTQPDEPSRTNE